MKKNIVLVVAFMFVCLHQLSAQDSVQVNPSAIRRFNEAFVGARNIHWISLPKKVVQAQFTYDGTFWLAYFDNAGNIITCGRKIKSVSDLPLRVQDGLKRARARLEKRGGRAEVIIIYEMMKEEATRYFVSFQNDSHLATFSISSDGISALEMKQPRRFEPQVSKDAIARKN